MKKLLLCLAAGLLLCGCSTAETEIPDKNGSDIIELKDSITIGKEGSYVLTGRLEGTVTIDADKNSKVQLILDGVSIHSESSAAIYVKQADKLTITLAEGSENILSNGGGFEVIDENNVDAVIFSKDDLSINGSGSLYVKAGGDGIDANGTLEITGGSTVVCTPTMGDTATMDYDVSATISGGSFIGTGAYGMAQSFSESGQAVIAVSVGNCSAGTEIRLCDSDGTEIVSHTPEYDFAVVIISNEQLVKGKSYTLYVGTLSGDIQAY